MEVGQVEELLRLWLAHLLWYGTVTRVAGLVLFVAPLPHPKKTLVTGTQVWLVVLGWWDNSTATDPSLASVPAFPVSSLLYLPPPQATAGLGSHQVDPLDRESLSCSVSKHPVSWS